MKALFIIQMHPGNLVIERGIGHIYKGPFYVKRRLRFGPHM